MAGVLDPLLDELHARPPLRAGSLIVSVFGDAVAPRGGRLSLASLLAVMRGFRVSDGLVRTALSRLVADGWFERWRTGRTSHYSLSERGRRTFALATDRIYGPPARTWSGAFDLVLVESGGERADLREGLAAQGYGTLAPDLMIAPAPGAAADGVLRFAASPVGIAPRALASRAWPLADLAARYEAFLARHAPARDGANALDGLDALVLRVLLIHDYRRVILRDPLLPADLLPQPWPGDAARRLCGALYRSVAPAAERWLDANAADERGALPPPDPSFRERFRDIGDAPG